jgi:hypothetical protein
VSDDTTPEADVVAAIEAAKQRLQSAGKKGERSDQMTLEDFLGEPDEG